MAPDEIRVERRDGRWRAHPGWLFLAVFTAVQVLVFYDHFAIALTTMFAIALGLWMRHWTAGPWAMASFLVAFTAAVATDWLDDFRWADGITGAGMALLGGLIAGGIFDLLRWESAPDRAIAEEEIVTREARYTQRPGWQTS